MKWTFKNILPILCALAMGAALLLYTTSVFRAPDAEAGDLYFSVSSADGTERIALFEGDDGIRYLFLPSYAQMEQVRIALGSDVSAAIGGYAMTDGMHCGDFSLDTDYAVSIPGEETFTLRFCRSANVATVHIDTASGTMRRIHENKEYEEYATVKILRQDGTAECYAEAGTLNGRGNTTWSYQKKPYVIKLTEGRDLFGMGTATDWVLLANAADGSHLNNKIIYDMARQGGGAWTPGCVYADLYLNGHYAGLYLLTEKVEAAEDRLALDPAAGDFFCEFRAAEEESEQSNCVATDRGRPAVILAPEQMDGAQKSRITELLRQLEQEIFSGKDLSDSDLIDLDSWVRRYILDEISSNVDADRASFYCYYSDGRFYAGPIWDYDKGFGNCIQSRNPCSFTANNQKRSAGSVLPYYSELYANSSFRKRVQELYAAEFLPMLNALTDGGLAATAAQISASTAMDSIRWRGLTPELQSVNLIATDADSVAAYLRQKTAFLSSAWIDGVDYCTVQFELSPGAEYVNYAVKRGSTFSSGDIDTKDTQWVDAQTGEVFDFGAPITKNTILHLPPVSGGGEQTVPQEGRPAAELLVIASVLLAGVLLLGMVGVDGYRRYTERRLTDGT